MVRAHIPFAVLATALIGCSSSSDPIDLGDRTPLQEHELAFSEANEFVSHRVERDSHLLAAREFDPTVYRGQYPVVMLHGYIDSQHIYDDIIPLVREDRRVITFDFLGWGGSDKPPGHTYDAASLRTDLEAVIDHFGLRRFDLVLQNASGHPGIDWALDNPERVNRLVLLNTIYHPTEALEAPEPVEILSNPGPERDRYLDEVVEDDRAWLDMFDRQMRQLMTRDAALERFLPVLAYQSLNSRPAFIGYNDVIDTEIQAREAERPRLQSFDRPVVLAFGAEDPFVNLGVADDFEATMPNVHRSDVAGAAHYVQLDEPERVAEIITIAELDP